MASIGKNKNILMSFKNAFIGIFDAIIHEVKIKVGLLIVLIGICVSIYFKITTIEWVLSILCSTIVIGFEMINTAIETTIDMAMPNVNPLAKRAKDMSAGAVVLAVITSAIIGLIIYLPYVIDLF